MRNKEDQAHDRARGPGAEVAKTHGEPFLRWEIQSSRCLHSSVTAENSIHNGFQPDWQIP